WPSISADTVPRPSGADLPDSRPRIPISQGMGLLSIFNRKKTAAETSRPTGRGAGKARAAGRPAPGATMAAPADAADAVRDARARARRRLMGATVLLLVGVIGFPLLF